VNFSSPGNLNKLPAEDRQRHDKIVRHKYPTASVDGRLESVTAAGRRYPKMKTRMPGMAAIVYKIFFCFFGGSNLREDLFVSAMSFTKMSAQPALPGFDV
jgi:hypothetical protein